MATSTLTDEQYNQLPVSLRIVEESHRRTLISSCCSSILLVSITLGQVLAESIPILAIGVTSLDIGSSYQLVLF